MAHEDDPHGLDRASYQPSSGTAVAVTDPVRNPELPPHLFNYTCRVFKGLPTRSARLCDCRMPTL